MPDRVAIVTDSVACLDRRHVEALDIQVVPVHLLIGEDDYRDGSISGEDLHDRIHRGEPASTAAPSSGEFAAVYEEAAGLGFSSVLALTVSGALSNIANAARVAAQDSLIPVEVVDTRTVASAQGLIVRRVAEAAAAGAILSELVAAAAEVRKRVGLMALVPALEALRKSGRVPRVVARIGDRLDLKPLIKIGDDGQAHPAGVARSSASGLHKMLERAVTTGGSSGARYVVMHTLAPEGAQRLAAELGARAREAEIEVAPFTAVMGIHTGPDLLGIAWERPLY